MDRIVRNISLFKKPRNSDGKLTTKPPGSVEDAVERKPPSESESAVDPAFSEAASSVTEGTAPVTSTIKHINSTVTDAEGKKVHIEGDVNITRVEPSSESSGGKRKRKSQKSKKSKKRMSRKKKGSRRF